MVRPLAVFAALFLTIAAHAERVRVVVALAERSTQKIATDAARRDVLASVEATSVEPWGSGRVFSAEIDAAEVDRLASDPRVRAVEIDRGGEGALLQSLPLIGINSVRAQGFDGKGVTVAVLDTGVDLTNRDFADRIVEQRCFCDNLNGTGCCPNGFSQQIGAGAASDDNGHGTNVTGILAGGGAIAPAGVAPAASIVAVKVMDRDNRFSNFTQLMRALEWIDGFRPDVRVINMSLGSAALYTTPNCASSAIAIGMQEVVGSLRARGVLITASSGNQGSKNATTLPACMQDVVGVGAVYDTPGNFTFYNCPDRATPLETVTCFTNSSDAIDVVAPGAPITAAGRGGGLSTYAGTSMASPHVAGVIALMLQASAGRLTSGEIEHILESTGRTAVDPRNALTFPSLDAAAAVAATPRGHAGPRRRSVRK